MTEKLGRGMTYQEANALVDDFYFVYKEKSISKEMLIECREVIHKALKKQTPKKLKVEKVGRFGLALICPSCESQVAMIWDSVLQGKYEQDYCDNCGQDLDWEDVK